MFYFLRKKALLSRFVISFEVESLIIFGDVIKGLQEVLKGRRNKDLNMGSCLLYDFGVNEERFGKEFTDAIDLSS